MDPKNHGKYFTLQEIAEQTHLTYDQCKNAMRRMAVQNLVVSRQEKGKTKWTSLDALQKRVSDVSPPVPQRLDLIKQRANLTNGKTDVKLDADYSGHYYFF
jgi:hypothetical protein